MNDMAMCKLQIVRDIKYHNGCCNESGTEVMLNFSAPLNINIVRSKS